MSVTPINRTPSLGLAAISELLARSNTELPPHLFHFFEMNDGCRLPTNIIAVTGARTKIEIHKILGVKQVISESSRMKSVFQGKYLAISPIEGGNWLCVGLAADRRDKVFYWDHELGEEEGDVRDNVNLFLLAEDIFDLFKKLTPFDPSSIRLAQGQLKKAWINPDFLKNINSSKKPEN